jgi:Uri superfamily endonuclease
MLKGLYCLEIYNSILQNIKAGKRYNICFDKGYYFYIGSALNGIESRVLRHLRNYKKFFWHIDYLLSNKDVAIKKIYYLSLRSYKTYKNTNYNKYLRKECEVAQNIKSYTCPIKRFGSSDCGCCSHLFFDINNKVKIIEDFLIKKYGFKNYSF